MSTHYTTLGINSTATRQQVKRAFRDMTKRFHPDRNAKRAEWAHVQMKRILEAHRVLSDQILREEYDIRLAAQSAAVRKPVSNLKHRREGDSLASQCERILFDLLSGQEDRAVENYEKLQHAGAELAHCLELRDWVDCKFLLAEHYARRGRCREALALYEELHQSETAQKRFSHFIQEVRERIFNLCSRDLPSGASPTAAAEFYLRALGLDLPRPRKAFLHKKLAECYLELDDNDSALRHLRIAFQLKPDMKGATKICRRLGTTPEKLAEPGP